MNYNRDFQTPPPVCEYMASLVPQHARTVLEPTPGEGNMVSVLEKKFNVIAPADFFVWKPEPVDSVVMNPPFAAKYADLTNAPESLQGLGMKVGYHILENCMQLSESVIALMPWFTISDSDVRLRRLHDYGLISVTLLPRKTFQYARIQTCVFELRKGYTGSTDFKVFDRLK